MIYGLICFTLGVAFTFLSIATIRSYGKAKYNESLEYVMPKGNRIV